MNTSLSRELWCSAVELAEQAINTALRLDPATVTAFGRLHGKVIAVEVEGLALTVYCLPGPTGLTLLSTYQGSPDTTIRGRPLALLQLAGRADSSSLLFRGDIAITGDIELGQRFKAILARTQVDFEELVSRISGDVVAHQGGVLLRECRRWWQASRERLHRDAADYLQFEQQLLPRREQIEAFASGVETLRDDVARLAARLDYLHTRLTR